MAVFIELTTDAFDDRFRSGQRSTAGVGKQTGTRRPLRGLEIKEETYAYIKLIDAFGNAIPLMDAGAVNNSGETEDYSNFILQSVQDARMERHNIVETFGETYLFLFGESPRFLNVSAVLLNSFDFNWKAEFMENYDKYLRGTRALEQGARTYLFYDSNVVEGYMLNAQVGESADNPLMCTLNFQLFITNYQNVSLIGGADPNYPIRSSAVFPGEVDPANPESAFFNASFTATASAFAGVGAGAGAGAVASASASAYLGSVNPLLTEEQPIADRTLPLRSTISDNRDEYLSGWQDESIQPGDPATSEVDNLNLAFGDAMAAYGVDPAFAYAGASAEVLGYAPAFLSAGVGVSASVGAAATFGAVATAGVAAGGFTGVKLPSGRGLGFFASVGATAQAGAYAGGQASRSARLGAGAYVGSESELVAGGNYLSGAGVASYNPQAQATEVAGWERSTSRQYGPISATASAKASVQTLSGSSYAQEQQRASARAGGYARSNSYLGATGRMPSGASYAHGTGAGAAVGVGGDVTAFSFASAPGSIENTEMPPREAMGQKPKQWSWSKSKSWPSG